MPENADPEVAALNSVISALQSLDDHGKSRVLDYAFKRFGITTPTPRAAPSSGGQQPLGASAGVTEGEETPRVVPRDIRSLKEEKSPGSADQMATLVAYYLAELAPAAERKDAIGADDIRKYFKQAGFPLLGRSRDALIKAKNAGYLDATPERGLYKLNPVGHNLVAHGLPKTAATRAMRAARAKDGRKRVAIGNGRNRSRSRNRG